MQALILTAGMGKKLAEFTQDKTQCMVPLLGKTLIEGNLDILIQFSLSRIILVVGSKGEDVENLIGKNYKGTAVEYVYNRDFDCTNKLSSLFMAREQFQKEDTILLESNLVFEKGVIETLLKYEAANSFLVARHQPWMDNRVVEIAKDHSIQRFISPSDFKYKNVKNYYKTVKIYKFSKKFITKSYIPFLSAALQSGGGKKKYNQVLGDIPFINKSDLKACILADSSLWYEINDKQDLSNAEILFADETKLTLMQQRFGGYWRFPKLLDFCYLVNPYFPKKDMIKEIMHNFNPLLRDYPSGLATQNLLASRMFGIREDSILTGNGAAELINALMGVLSEQKVGFILPTFNEYAERHESTKSVLFQVEDESFAYGKEEIIRWSDSVDTLVLINPDNPSGNFIPLNDLYEILDSFNKRNKRLMLDESFVDFSTGGPENSIISNENLDKYANLVVIKSISKSYGVPGIRLGIMATSDKELLEKVKKRISIWNINSFGEFFMQIYGKYEKSYIKSCRKIADERDRFFTKLETIPWLTPHYSQANYFLCDVEGFNTTRLVDHILKEHSIFLKDLRGKKGFEQKNCIRIAVRSREDNKKLISAFRSLTGKSII